MSEYYGDATATDVSYDDVTYAADDYGNVYAEHNHVDGTAYDFNGDGYNDYVEADASSEVYAQDSQGNWAYAEADASAYAYS
jgi:hypothetical protein